MKFEIGKFYKNRDGQKVQIHMLDRGDGMMLGAAVNDDGVWFHNSWHQNGRWKGSEHRLDIISEWEEPKKPKLLAPALVCYCGKFQVSSNLYSSEMQARNELRELFRAWPAVPNKDGFYEVME
jgi:hypothetical protein